MGSKRNLLTDARGTPLSVAVCGANRRDVTQLPKVLEAIVVSRPKVTDEAPQNLCADAGYVGEEARQQMEMHGYSLHVRPRGEEIDEKAKNPDYKPRRWVTDKFLMMGGTKGSPGLALRRSRREHKYPALK